MSGKIEVKIRLGLSKTPDILGYPEWYLEVTSEDNENQKVTLSPTWANLRTFISDVKVHEVRTDTTRERANDADKWQDSMEKSIKQAQTILDTFKVPEIYSTHWNTIETINSYLQGIEKDSSKLKLLDHHCWWHLNQNKYPIKDELKMLMIKYYLGDIIIGKNLEILTQEFILD